MQKPAKQFIDLLESQQLLAPDVLEELRRQIDESKARLTTELLAKLLVDNGHLTKFQATKLIAEIKEPSENPTADSASSDDEEELGLAEESSNSPAQPSKGKPVAAVFTDDEDVDEEVVEGEAVEVVEDGVVEVPATEPVAANVAPVQEDAFSNAPRAAARPIRPKKNDSNPYDSFRILGVGILLALILVAGFFLVNWMWKGNADDRLKRADESYEQRSYETAANMYKEFTVSFPAHAKASYAKVRAALAALRKDSEGAPDPNIGLTTALQVLPPVAGEAAMAEQQSDLAGALIALAGKFNERADRTQTTADRKALIAELDKLMELINDPQYVGANQRSQQAPSLNRIKEDRERIVREISRDEELTAALAEIDMKLEAKDTLAAYDVRKALINRYPLLEADAGLTERILKASVIQRSQVQPGNLNVKLSKQTPPQGEGKSFILANRSNGSAPKLKGQVLFVKAKGSVYGLDGANGDILWRKFVGREFNSEPIRIGATSAADVVVCQPEQGQLSRLVGKSGDTQWFADLGKPIYNPTADDQDLFVATFDGTVASLDVGGGQVKWSAVLPQPASVAPGVASGKPQAYVAAEHSNLYVLSRSDGTCQEVFYLGHRPGSIVVPPILLLGQLFVFENINSDTSRIRILSTSDQGLELKDAQSPIAMDGNIVVPPRVDGRRLFIQTDLGQIKVLDIEPTVETQKVSEIVTVPKNVFEPKQSWLITDNNRVWVADNQLTRFDLQVTSGAMHRVWIENDGDRFVGAPQLIGDLIIHTRTQAGTAGVRVAAVTADTGAALWQTDLAIPVTFVNSTGSGYDAVNSSGMLYALGNKPIRVTADENPGQGQAAMLFANPTVSDEGQAVLFNQSRGNQLAVYSPKSSQKLRILVASFRDARPSCDAVAIADKVVVGLDSGQLVLLNLTNGAIVGSPYQPQLEAGKAVRWNTPAYLPDSQTLIVASDLQKLVRLSVGNDNFRQLGEVALESPLLGPIVAADQQVCVVQSTKSGDSLLFFNPTNLNKVGEVQLPGRLRAGPFARPQGVLIQTDSKLTMISADAKPLWEIDFPESSVLGSPIEFKGNLVLATRSGNLWSISPTDGALGGKVQAGQALSSQPLVLPAGILVGSDEGAVLAIEFPSSKPEPR